MPLQGSTVPADVRCSLLRLASLGSALATATLILRWAGSLLISRLALVTTACYLRLG